MTRETGREQTPPDRCPSWTRLHGHDYACSYPVKAKHDECMALVRGDNGQDVAVKWASATARKQTPPARPARP